MSGETIFRGQRDRFHGVEVASSLEPCHDLQEFSRKLKASLQSWRQTSVRGVWFKVELEHAEWVPVLARNEFTFHHARPEYVMMVRWLPQDSNPIPFYAHHYIGIGAIVYDSDTKTILVVQEKYYSRMHWKFPGGYVEPGEDMDLAVKREVFEETGVDADFVSIVSFRHWHQYNFGCSDIYFVCHMRPSMSNAPITGCPDEIVACRWMKIEEYLDHPEVIDFNRMVVRNFLSYIHSDAAIPITKAVSMGGRPYSLFSLQGKATQD